MSHSGSTNTTPLPLVKLIESDFFRQWLTNPIEDHVEVFDILSRVDRFSRWCLQAHPSFLDNFAEQKTHTQARAALGRAVEVLVDEIDPALRILLAREINSAVPGLLRHSFTHYVAPNEKGAVVESVLHEMPYPEILDSFGYLDIGSRQKTVLKMCEHPERIEHQDGAIAFLQEHLQGRTLATALIKLAAHTDEYDQKRAALEAAAQLGAQFGWPAVHDGVLLSVLREVPPSDLDWAYQLIGEVRSQDNQVRALVNLYTKFPPESEEAQQCHDRILAILDQMENPKTEMYVLFHVITDYVASANYDGQDGVSGHRANDLFEQYNTTFSQLPVLERDNSDVLTLAYILEEQPELHTLELINSSELRRKEGIYQQLCRNLPVRRSDEAIAFALEQIQAPALQLRVVMDLATKLADNGMADEAIPLFERALELISRPETTLPDRDIVDFLDLAPDLVYRRHKKEICLLAKRMEKPQQAATLWLRADRAIARATAQMQTALHYAWKLNEERDAVVASLHFSRAIALMQEGAEHSAEDLKWIIAFAPEQVVSDHKVALAELLKSAE